MSVHTICATVYLVIRLCVYTLTHFKDSRWLYADVCECLCTVCVHALRVSTCHAYPVYMCVFLPCTVMCNSVKLSMMLPLSHCRGKPWRNDNILKTIKKHATIFQKADIWCIMHNTQIGSCLYSFTPFPNATKESKQTTKGQPCFVL